jgi:hypothetical protein
LRTFPGSFGSSASQISGFPEKGAKFQSKKGRKKPSRRENSGRLSVLALSRGILGAF